MPHPFTAGLDLRPRRGFGATALTAEYMEKNERQKLRAFSPASSPMGGRTVWLAGPDRAGGRQGARPQRQFRRPGPGRSSHLMDQTLNKAGGGVRPISSP